MGDPQRFKQFAQLITQQFPKQNKIADIAAGCGELSYQLIRQGKQSTAYDCRYSKLKPARKHIAYSFDFLKSKKEYELLVGMHPDEATEIIIKQASERKIPFVIVPCCPKTFYTKDKIEKHKWLAHLRIYANKLKFNTRKLCLDIEGDNIVLIGYPY
jgi:hypothetical protein